jgi:hypothetical protein
MQINGPYDVLCEHYYLAVGCPVRRGLFCVEFYVKTHTLQAQRFAITAGV